MVWEGRFLGNASATVGFGSGIAYGWRLMRMRAADDPGIQEREGGALRGLLSGVFLLGSLGTLAELLLLGHFEDPLQWTPLALLTTGLVLMAVFFAKRNRRILRLFQATMILFVAGGFLGLVLHYRANMEFELEMYPTIGGWKLFWESIQGATPALAPGAMVQLGLLGLVYTCRHPAARPSAAGGGTKNQGVHL